MIKKFSVLILLLFSFVSHAQQGTASPYSIFGIGDERYKGTAEIRAMAGVSVFADSIHINLQNPASYANLIYTTFTLGGSFTATKFKTDNTQEKAQRSTMDYVAVGIPLSKKAAFGFGVIPFSSVGYKVINVDDVNLRVSKFLGSGGMNKAYLSFGYKLFPNFNLGVDVNYNFGQIETTSIKYQESVEYGTQEINSSQLSGFNFNFGAMYRAKIMKKYDFFSGFTYIPQNTITSDNQRDIFTVTFSDGFTPPKVDTNETLYSETKLQAPSKMTIGAGFGSARKWMIGGEVAFKGSSNFGNRYSDLAANVKYENGTRYSIGGFYIPKYNSFNGYMQKVTYRGGFRYETTGLVIDNVSIKDYAITGGLGLPLGGTNSNLNIGFEFGRRGTTASNLIQENYGSLILSLSFNDRWFIRSKYN